MAHSFFGLISMTDLIRLEKTILISGNSIGFGEEIKKLCYKNVFCMHAYLERCS